MPKILTVCPECYGRGYDAGSPVDVDDPCTSCRQKGYVLDRADEFDNELYLDSIGA